LSEPARMSFFDHLIELRRRLVWALLGVGVAVGAVYNYREAVTAFLLSPYLHYVNDGGGGKPVVLSLGEGLAFDMKISIWVGLVLAAPWIAVQIWLFVRPALKPSEVRFGVPAFLSLGVLFVAGVAFAFKYMLPPMFKFFIEYNQGRFTPIITISNLWEMESSFLLWTGLIFEMPVIFFVLALIGLVGPLALVKFWRYAIVISAIAAAVITPTADPVNMGIMMAPIMLLYGVSIGAAALGVAMSRRKTA
jgi:sec-independent protein translocase protein TatC